MDHHQHNGNNGQLLSPQQQQPPPLPPPGRQQRRFNHVPVGGPTDHPSNSTSTSATKPLSPSPGTIYASSPGDSYNTTTNNHNNSGPYPGLGPGGPVSSGPDTHHIRTQLKREPGYEDDDQYGYNSDEDSRRRMSRLSNGYPDQNDSAAEARRKKQKRNKPTLSCFECVERKTKCDRGRPHCLACIKRQTECKYALVANLLEETTRTAANGRRMTKPPKHKSSGSVTSPNIPNIADRGVLATRTYESRSSVALSTGLLSNVPYSIPTASNVFGIGSEHPFANYWSPHGGLSEVLAVLPEKMQSDILINRYFECVDPVYPMIHRQTFYADYAHFWAMPPSERHTADAAFIALILIMLALGTQFVSVPNTLKERADLAEFLASGSNQALRMSSYLSTASIRSIQTMVLVTYFLINDNHASDGWAFAGVLMRQSYAMGLHRDPNVVTPEASIFEKQQRRKVWQAVLLQDTFLTVLLSLPPNATHTDVSVDDLEDEGSIAASNPTDTAYIRGSWTLANLVQESICSPRCLDMPICATARHKTKLVSDFRAVYRAFPDIFRSWDSDSLAALAQTNNRVARQTLFLTSNYFHNLMLVHASESPDVPFNVRGTLEAAHDAINSFFMLYSLFELEARVWWVFNHRAFLEALCIGSVLRETLKEPEGAEMLAKDQLFVRARNDICRMIQILSLMGEGDNGSEVARTRVQVLSEFL